MWLSSDHRGDRTFVRGDFVSPRLWLIFASVARGSEADPATASARRQRTLSDLWQGIQRESRVGRRLGAFTIRVVFDGDQEISALFASNEAPKASPAPARPVDLSPRPALLPPSRRSL